MASPIRFDRWWRRVGPAAVGLLFATGALSTPSASAADSTLPQEAPTPLPQWRPARPNIVYILCDDLGYGDVHALNPDRSKIPTPNMDRLASQGLSFTDAHASSSLCTPSRYSILTGRYAWRTRLQAGVLGGDAPPLIAPGRLTVATLLKQKGYDTVAFGKWHEGLAWGPGHWHGTIIDGPLQHGFDHFFGISASLDMPPFAFIDDDHFTQQPTVRKTWVNTGLAAADFDPTDVVPTLVQRAGDYLKQRARATEPNPPFFLYLPLTSPHTPLVPTPAFKGKSPLGPYGDFVIETDWAVGEVLAAIDAAGLADSTMVVFTSDNGFAPYVGAKPLEAKGHYPSAEFRGYKNDVWDGGHREPLMVRWPGHVAAGSRSDQIVGLIDLMATLAQVTGTTLPPDAGEDSVSLLPILLGQQRGPLRYAQVQQSGAGYFAIRRGKWKLELCAGSGGWAAPTEPTARQQHLPPVQLYDMEADPAEQHNVEADHPDEVARLTQLLETSVAEGRTTPGPTQPNDAAIVLRKRPAAATRP